MDNFWFKRKTYGWGWTPATWQGWAVTAFYILAIIALFRDVDKVSRSISELLVAFGPAFAFITLLFILICWKKGEQPPWQKREAGSETGSESER
jgi:hypothetical protein